MWLKMESLRPEAKVPKPTSEAPNWTENQPLDSRCFLPCSSYIEQGSRILLQSPSISSSNWSGHNPETDGLLAHTRQQHVQVQIRDRGTTQWDKAGLQSSLRYLPRVYSTRIFTPSSQKLKWLASPTSCEGWWLKRINRTDTWLWIFTFSWGLHNTENSMIFM